MARKYHHFGPEGRLKAGGLLLDFPDNPDIDEGYKGRSCTVVYELSRRKIHVYVDGIELGGSTKKWVLSELSLYHDNMIFRRG
jgi:hypothetical protein